MVLTGLDDEALAAQALREGAQDYLIKGQLDGYGTARGILRSLHFAIERKIMEDTLFIEKERAQATLNCIGDAVACTDNLGNLTFVNPVAEKMTGWTWQEAAGRPMAEIFRILNHTNREIIPNPMDLAVRSRPNNAPARELHSRSARRFRNPHRKLCFPPSTIVMGELLEPSSFFGT